MKSYFRVVKRWIKQRTGKEDYNHPPTFGELIYFLSAIGDYYKGEKNLLNNLEDFKSKIVFVNNKKMNMILK